MFGITVKNIQAYLTYVISTGDKMSEQLAREVVKYHLADSLHVNTMHGKSWIVNVPSPIPGMLVAIPEDEQQYFEKV